MYYHHPPHNMNQSDFVSQLKRVQNMCKIRKNQMVQQSREKENIAKYTSKKVARSWKQKQMTIEGVELKSYK